MRTIHFLKSGTTPEALAFLALSSGWTFLLFHPALADPRSYAVALSIPLLLLFLRPLRAPVTGAAGVALPALAALALLSAAWSLCPGVSLQAGGLLCGALLLFLCVREWPEEWKERLFAYGALLASVAALLGIAQWLWGFDQIHRHLGDYPRADYDALWGASSQKRAFGPLETSGALGALLILFLPGSLEAALRREGIARAGYLLACVCLTAGLFACQSIGAAGCLALAFLISGWASKDRRLQAASLGAAAVVAALFVYRGWGHWTHASWGNRLLLWERALRLAAERPFFGAGAGCFEEAYRASGIPLEGGSRFAHDLPLQALVELGVIGLSLLGFTLWDFLRRSGRGWTATGAGRGALAVALFSLVDLPWVMPELLVATAFVAALAPLEPVPAVEVRWKIPTAWVDAGLLGILVVSVFFPPFRPWNLALVGGALVFAAAYRRAELPELPAWMSAAWMFFVIRSFLGVSQSGTARFLTTSSLVLLFVLWLRSTDRPARTLLFFARAGAVWMAAGWVHFIQDPHLLTTGYFYPNPKHLGSFLCVWFLLEWANAKKDAWSKGWMALTVATMALYRSTGALLGWFVGLVAMNLRGARAWGKRFYAGAALFLGALFAWRFFSGWDGLPWGRLKIWKAAWTLWKEHPFLGWGPGAFDGLFHTVKEPESGKALRYLMDARYVHNEWFEALVSFGAAGFILIVFFLVWAWRRLPSEKRAILTGSGVNAFFDFTWHTPVLAFQAAGAAGADETGPRPARAQMGSALLALGVAAGLWGAAAWVPRAVEEAARARAEGGYPLALMRLQESERLAGWDSTPTVEKADLLEGLYLATGDERWRAKSDDAFNRMRESELVDGRVDLAFARRDAGRLRVERSEAAFQTAWNAYDRAGRTLPFSTEPRREAGDLARAVGRWDLARGKYLESLALEPNDATTHAALGDLEWDARDQAAAREEYGVALALDAQWKPRAILLDPDERKMLILSDDERLRASSRTGAR